MYLNEKQLNEIFCVDKNAFIEGYFIFYPFNFYYARVRLNSGWLTAGGTRTTA
jgi:hypothetical protein